MSAPVIRRPDIALAAAARALAEANHESEPQMIRTYWFPNDAEVRLVHVDPTTTPSRTVMPFYFDPSVRDGLPYASAIALIRPEEEGVLTLPTGWGDWASAHVWEWM